MILTLILGLIYGLIWVILLPLRVLPDVSLPDSIITAFITLSGYLASLNAMLPYSTASILAVLGFIIVVEAGILTYKGIMWLIRKIPTIN